MALDVVILCSKITIIRLEHCDNTKKLMVLFSAREHKNLFSHDEFCLCVSGARNLKAFKDNLDPGEKFTCKFLIPELQGNLNLEGTLESSAYGFSPEEVSNITLKLHVGDFASRKGILVEHISQLQYAYGSAGINDSTTGKRLNEGKPSKHRLVKNFQSDDSLKDKNVPWNPRFGMKMVSVDRNLVQKCLQQFFSREDTVRGSEAVRRGALGDEILARELWGVLSLAEKASVLV